MVCSTKLTFIELLLCTRHGIKSFPRICANPMEQTVIGLILQMEKLRFTDSGHLPKVHS